MLVVFGLDGVLADNGNRVGLPEGLYQERAFTDVPIESSIKVLEALLDNGRSTGDRVEIWSERGTDERELAERWLAEHIPFFTTAGALHLRPLHVPRSQTFMHFSSITTVSLAFVAHSTLPGQQRPNAFEDRMIDVFVRPHTGLLY